MSVLGMRVKIGVKNSWIVTHESNSLNFYPYFYFHTKHTFSVKVYYINIQLYIITSTKIFNFHIHYLKCFTCYKIELDHSIKLFFIDNILKLISIII